MGRCQDPIAEAIHNLKLALVNLTSRAIELDAVPLTERARLTYTDGGQTYGWNEYRASIDQAIAAKQKAIQDLTPLAWGGQTVYSIVR